MCIAPSNETYMAGIDWEAILYISFRDSCIFASHMPLYREWSSDPFSLAAIWEINEPESFFTDHTGIIPDIKNEKRRLEHVAGRFLLKHLKQDFPLLSIRPDEYDKPRVDDNQYYFSISHSFPYVAAVVSPYVECGIDIQVWHRRMVQLQHKFLSEIEQQFLQNDPRLITVAWCAKEAAYKWQGRRGVEFIDHLPIIKFQEHQSYYDITIYLQLTSPKINIIAKAFTVEDFACSYVTHSRIEHPLFN